MADPVVFRFSRRTLYTGKCSIYYILGEATNPSLGSKKRLGDHQIQENGASMLKVARVNH